MTILQSNKDKINKRAFEKYSRNQKNSIQRLEIQEILRRDEIQFQRDSRSLVYVPVHLDPVVRPSGQTRFEKLKNARAKAGESEASGGASAPLVTPAKSQSHFLPIIDKETGEYQEVSFNPRGNSFDVVFDENEHLINQFLLQSEAREILKSELKNNDSGRAVPIYRVCDCLRNRVSGSEGVEIVSSSLSEKARFKGLQSCGSVWHCPVCSARVSEVRRQMLREMSDQWQRSGGGLLFITNTVRHNKQDDLRLMLDNILDLVWNRYINHRSYKNLRKSLGYIGRVRALEVTHGHSNGWHPHIHELWFIEKPVSRVEMAVIQNSLHAVWNTTLENAGMSSVTLKRGVTVQNGSNALDYISKFGRQPKWDIGRELTSGHSKKSRGSSRTPFDLLRSSLSGDTHAAALFREYAIAFSGKRQLYFSTGLKDFFCLNIETDEQISKSVSYDIATLSHLSRDDWRLVLRFGDRGSLLVIARSGGDAAVRTYLDSIKQKQNSFNA